MTQSQEPTTLSTGGEPLATKTLRCACIGVGRMGRHHARKYAQMEGVELVAIVDANEDRRETAGEEHGCLMFADEAGLLDLDLDAVTIAVPTKYHLKCATPLLKAGIACLIEKPLAMDEEESSQLVKLAEENDATLMVGHIERFNPVVRALERVSEEGTPVSVSEAIKPRFIEVHRVSPMPFRSLDVSVVMDMMIHDLDVVLWLMEGREPVEIQASGVAVLSDGQEDVCNARLTFETPQGKCVANITASRLAMKTERKMRIFGENAYVSIDYGKKSGVFISKNANSPQFDEIKAAIRDGKDLSDLDYNDLLTIEHLDGDDADQLEMEVRSFLDCVRTKRKPPIDAQAGFAAVRTAQRIIEIARQDW